MIDWSYELKGYKLRYLKILIHEEQFKSIYLLGL